MLSIILSVFGSALGNPFGRAALAALGLIFSYNIAYYRGVWSVDVAGIKRAAADDRDSQWRNTLDVARKQDENAVQAAIDAGKAEPPVPADKSERVRECGKSPTCRDRRK